MVKKGIKSFETGAADSSGLLGAIVQRYPFMKQKGDPTGYVSTFMPDLSVACSGSPLFGENV